MVKVEAKLSVLKKFKSYLIRKLLPAESVVGWQRRLSSKLEHRQGPKPGLVANEEADAADSRSQSDKCIPIETGLPVPSDIPRPLTFLMPYRVIWSSSSPRSFTPRLVSLLLS